MKSWLRRHIDHFVINRAKGYPPVLPYNGLDTVDAAPEHYIVMTAIAKNEGPYLEEWIEFHRLVGVEKFIIYDNGSTDDTAAKLARYVDAGIVTLLPWRHFDNLRNTQLQAYAHALANFGHLTKWMGFFDIDEFVFSAKYMPLDVLLKEFEDVPALGVAGVFFSSSGYQVPPGGLVIEKYLHAVPFELQVATPSLLQVKSFVQPRRVASPGIHYCRITDTSNRFFTEKKIAIGDTIKRTASLQSIHLVRYNHYFSKSEQDLRNKYERGSAEHPSFSQKRTLEIIERSNLIETLATKDYIILHYLSALKERMAFR